MILTGLESVNIRAYECKEYQNRIDADPTKRNPLSERKRRDILNDSAYLGQTEAGIARIRHSLHCQHLHMKFFVFLYCSLALNRSLQMRFDPIVSSEVLVDLTRSGVRTWFVVFEISALREVRVEHHRRGLTGASVRFSSRNQQ